MAVTRDIQEPTPNQVQKPFIATKIYLDNISELIAEYENEDNIKLLDYYKELIAQFELLEIS